MYFQPYGDEQQLNLNWIINEIINLHKQLDPDYETPSFTQVYPYSNLNRLNLDWILSELKALKELAPEPTPTEIDIQAVAEALVALPFDSSKSYQIYDFISKDGEIWRATETIAAGGVWDETKWFKTKLGTDLAVLERWINAINNSLTSLQNTVGNLSSIDISDDSDAGGATVKASLNNLKGSLNTLDSDITALEDDVADLQDGLTTEQTTRASADTALQNALKTIGGYIVNTGTIDSIQLGGYGKQVNATTMMCYFFLPWYTNAQYNVTTSAITLEGVGTLTSGITVGNIYSNIFGINLARNGTAGEFYPTRAIFKINF